MNAAIYSRVSTDRQVDEGFSLEAQHDKLMQYVKMNDYILTRIYNDPGESAKDLNRPGVQDMIADLKTGKFNVLVVHKLDRLTRNISDLYNLVEMVNAHQVKLISLSENIDTSTPMGRMFVYILGIMAQMFRENLREEVVKGMSQRAAEGFRNGGAAPYGYTFNDGVLTIEEDKADTIRFIFDAYLNKDLGSFRIANQLNRDGIMGNRDGNWHQSTIVQILRSHTYAGKYHWKLDNQSEDQRIVREGEHEAIIDQATFDAVQKKLERRGNYERSRSIQPYPFTTIIKCAQCGRPYHGNTRVYKGKSFHNYRCMGRMKYGATCTNKDISEYKFVKLFFAYIETFQDDFILDKPKHQPDKERKRIEKELQKSETRCENWHNALGDGKMLPADYFKMIDKEMLRVQELKNQLAQLPQDTAQFNRDDALEAVRNLEKNWGYLDNRERKNIVQTLVKRIVFMYTDKICKIQEIEFY